MSQGSKVLSCAFLSIDLILLVISAITFYYHFTSIRSAAHAEGIIVGAVWYNNHSNDADDNGSWYPVVTFCPTPDYTLIFNSSIGSDFYENSEGDRVNTYYPPGHPEQAGIDNPRVNSFKWGSADVADVIFGSVGPITTLPSIKRSHRKQKSRP